MKRSALVLFLCAATILADDWPQFRGPNRDGISRETGFKTKWPAEGPARLWQANVGAGWSSISVAAGRA